MRNEAEEAARNLLLEWAARRHASGEASLSELAAETGVPIEVIEEHVSGQRSAQATDMYPTSARRLAEALKTPRRRMPQGAGASDYLIERCLNKSFAC